MHLELKTAWKQGHFGAVLPAILLFLGLSCASCSESTGSAVQDSTAGDAETSAPSDVEPSDLPIDVQDDVSLAEQLDSSDDLDAAETGPGHEIVGNIEDINELEGWVCDPEYSSQFSYVVVVDDVQVTVPAEWESSLVHEGKFVSTTTCLTPQMSPRKSGCHMLDIEMASDSTATVILNNFTFYGAFILSVELVGDGLAAALPDGATLTVSGQKKDVMKQLAGLKPLYAVQVAFDQGSSGCTKATGGCILNIQAAGYCSSYVRFTKKQ